MVLSRSRKAAQATDAGAAEATPKDRASTSAGKAYFFDDAVVKDDEDQLNSFPTGA